MFLPGTAPYPDPGDSSSESDDDDDVVEDSRPEVVNSAHRPPEVFDDGPIPPSVVINNPVTGNGFSAHAEPDPVRAVVAQPPAPPQLENSVKVENIFVLNGRRTSRDKSPVPPPLRVTPVPPNSVPVKTEPGSEPPLSKEELRCVLIRNQNMRQMIYKEVKRPGKDYTKLFAMLKDLHGPPSVRRSYICDVIGEARRFKRETLVDKLEKSLDDLISVV